MFKRVIHIAILLILVLDLRSQSKTDGAMVKTTKEYITKAYKFFPDNQIDSGLIYTKKAYANCLSLNNDSLLAHCHYLYGRYYFDIASYDSSIIYSKKAMEAYLKFGNEKGACKAMIRISDAYNRLGKYDKASDILFKVQNLSKKINDTNTYVNSCISAYELNINLEQNHKAFSILIKANDFVKNSKQYILKHTLSATLCYYYSKVKVNPDSCLYFAKESLKYALLSERPFFEVEAYFSLGEAYQLKGDYMEAKKYFEKALASSESSEQIYAINSAKFSLGELYYNEKNYKKSISYFQEILPFYQENNLIKEIYDIYWWLSKNEEALGSYRQAFNHFKMYSEGYDSLVTNDKIESLNQKYTALEVREKEKELKLKQEAEEKIQKALFAQRQQYIVIGFILFIIAIGSLFVFSYNRYKFNKERKEQALVLQLKDSEIKALQAQMNPHFIFNSLNSVLEFIRQSQKEEALKYLTKFSRLIRMVLESSNKKTILVSSEIELLGLYVDLENLRFGNNFIYTVHVDENLDIDNTEIPALIIQPFMENAILHGLQNKQKLSSEKKEAYQAKLFLELKQEGGFLKCVIEDNGIGREKAEEIKKNKLFKHHSMGMRITKDRLNLLSQNKCKIDFFDLKDKNELIVGTRVEILIPLIENF